jgi:His-Xaa-Ser system radical SAM maturase HxsB
MIMTAKLELPEFDEKTVAPMRFRKLGERYLLSNDFGRFRFLSVSQFRDFVEGRLPMDNTLGKALAEDGFVRDRMDFGKLNEVWRRRNRFLWQGPGLHVIIVTLRCNHRCLYCHASSVPMSDTSCDMTEDTARRVVDRIFETPSPSITIEFQGGEPLANWPVVKFIVDYARSKNEQAKKSLWLNLVSNMSLMDKEKLDYLLERDVNFCTSLDGPEDLHNKNRLHVGGASHSDTVGWCKRIRRKTAGRVFRVDALLTVTRFSLDRAKDIIDEYLTIGARGIFLRSLNNMGLARETWSRIGYAPEEFLAFYEKALDYILEINRKKVFFEQAARLFLAKILSDDDPNFLDLRSPCGAGIGQIAYNFDGGLYTCDEGRMLSRMGDDSFRIGSVREGTYAEALSHPTVGALAVASCLDNQVECSQCVYKPYCGVCPIQCYAEQGDIIGRMPSNSRCRINKGMLDIIFKRIEDPVNRKIFKSWLKKRDNDVLYQRH